MLLLLLLDLSHALVTGRLLLKQFVMFLLLVHDVYDSRVKPIWSQYFQLVEADFAPAWQVLPLDKKLGYIRDVLPFLSLFVWPIAHRLLNGLLWLEINRRLQELVLLNHDIRLLELGWIIFLIICFTSINVEHAFIISRSHFWQSVITLIKRNIHNLKAIDCLFLRSTCRFMLVVVVSLSPKLRCRACLRARVKYFATGPCRRDHRLLIDRFLGVAPAWHDTRRLKLLLVIRIDTVSFHHLIINK